MMASKKSLLRVAATLAEVSTAAARRSRACQSLATQGSCARAR